MRPPRMVELSGAEALWLLGGATRGRLVYPHRGRTVLRPAGHVLDRGRLVVRTPVPVAALAAYDPAGPAVVAYHADEIDPTTGSGWSITATGQAEPVRDPDETAHYRRTLRGWVHGPHDSLILIHPQTIEGHRLLATAEGAVTRHA